jgi:hypothetical protein
MARETRWGLAWVAAFAVAAGACSSDSSSGGGDASMADDTGTQSDGPSSDAGTCNVPECFRPINCRLTCSGPILSSSCCPCAPPTFDDTCCSNGTCAQ